jgi:hypothetical protein
VCAVPAAEAAAARSALAAEAARRGGLYLEEMNRHFDKVFGLLTEGQWPLKAPRRGKRAKGGAPRRPEAPEEDLPKLSGAKTKWAPREKVELRQVAWQAKQTAV